MGIGLVVLSAVYSFFGFVVVTNENLDRAREVEILRRLVQISLDCSATRNNVPATCNPGTAIAIYSDEGKIYINDGTSGTFTRSGNAYLKAACASRREIYQVKYAWKKDAGCDPPNSEDCWKSLFSVPVGCP